MVIQMVSLDEAEVGVSEVAEMNGGVHPLFGNVSLNRACEQYRRRVDWEKKTERHSDHEQRYQVAQFPADVPPVERVLMVRPVQRVQALVQIAADDSLPGREPSVKDIPMKEIFHQRPHEQSQGETHKTHKKMPGAQDEHRHDRGKRPIEDRD